MPWRAVLIAVALAVTVTACGTSETPVSNRFGDCELVPKTSCPGQDLTAVTAAYIDLSGADLSGAKFEGADLHNAILRGANLSKADLSAADLTGADLRDANLSGAIVFRATLENADWFRSVRTGLKVCNTVLPDGTVSDCPELTPKPTTVAPPAPQVTKWEFASQARCVVDAAGSGVELSWAVRNADNVAFSVDGARLLSDTDSSGEVRLPVACDNAAHTFEITAYGAAPPPATRTATRVIAPGEPVPPPGN